MKKILVLFLITFQFAHATEKDSLNPVNPFTKYYFFMEEDDDCYRGQYQTYTIK